ncbi:hypothetical protein NC981_19230 [Leptolyngbya sp. DQ-M1]|uniref:hypothetical protein n=1 Tax=Leptolyngbya sp. DQ-M1 TaxID=2933920 RepID=UPI00329A6B32
MNEFLPILEKAQFSSDFQDWALPTALVAEGFGCTAEAVRSHKTRNRSELREGAHWIKVIDPDNIARIYWSKRGIMRLGFLIDSPRAKLFRDAAESYLVPSLELEPEPVPSTELAAIPPVATDARCNVQRRSLEAEIAVLTGIGQTFLIAVALFYAAILTPFWVGGGDARE